MEIELNASFREELREICRKAIAEIGPGQLRKLSWFYRSTVGKEKK